jgi:hypothetical protein
VTGLLADALGFWLVATAACSALLGTVVAGQAAMARARRPRPRRRRSASAGAGVPSALDRGAGPRA